MQDLEDGNQELTRHGEREITAGKLHDQRVPEINRFAEIGEVVGGPRLPLRLSSQLQQEVRLADEVERHVGQRDVFLEDWPMAAPLGEAMAEDQAIVAQAKEEGSQGHPLSC